MAIGLAADQGQEVALAIYGNIPFDPVYQVFPRESAVFLAPFLDLTTEASR